MTRRERKERRAERRRDWAAGRDTKAAHLEASVERFRGDWAFNSQPGHIPERDRIIRRSEKAFEDRNMAQHHRERAAGIEDQLERTVFSDDVDAAERLEARIAEREAERDAKKKANAAWRKAGKPNLDSGADAWRPVAEAIGNALTKEALSNLGLQGRWHGDKWIPFSWAKPFDLTNLGAAIRQDQKRLDELRVVAAQRERVRAVIEEEGGECWSCHLPSDRPAGSLCSRCARNARYDAMAAP